MQGIYRWLKRYFIPHKHNNHKPHFLGKKSMLFFLTLVILVELGFVTQVFVVFDKTNFLATVLPGVITELTNEEREDINLSPLKENDLLNKAAQLKADDMAKNGYFAHTSPEGKTPWYWFNEVGYRYSYAGENLAVNFFESEDVAQAWMNSPSHRANITKADFTEIGVGVASGNYKGRNTIFVAQLFGTPVNQPISTTSTPSTPNPVTIPTPVPTPTPKPVAAVNKPISVPTTTPTPLPQETVILGEETTSPATDAEKVSISSIKSVIQRILTSPRQYTTYVFMGIALIMLIGLMLAVFVNHKIQHPRLVARGLLLVILIAGISFFNRDILKFETEVPESDISANVINSLE